MHLNSKIVAALVITAAVAAYPFVINYYAFYPDRENLIEKEHLPENVEEIFISTPDGHKLQCYWLPSSPGQAVVIYFHGNSGNIGQRIFQLQKLAEAGVNVLGVGYRGYGKSTGRPSERGIYADGLAALDYAAKKLGFKKDCIFLLGRSIGSAVALETARGLPLAGVILISPLTSGRQMAKVHGFGPMAWLAGNKFDNLEKIDQLMAPLLIIHGTRDEITPFKMGKQLYEKAHGPKKFVSIPGGGHNDIGWNSSGLFWDAIEEFISNYKSLN